MSFFGIALLIFLLVVFVASLLFAPIGWRTRVFNWVSVTVTGAIGIIQLVVPALTGFDFTTFLTAKEAAIAAAFIALANTILREVTNTPPGKSL